MSSLRLVVGKKKFDTPATSLSICHGNANSYQVLTNEPWFATWITAVLHRTELNQ
jgi:hypothetical protein